MQNSNPSGMGAMEAILSLVVAMATVAICVWLAGYLSLGTGNGDNGNSNNEDLAEYRQFFAEQHSEQETIEKILELAQRRDLFPGSLDIFLKQATVPEEAIRNAASLAIREYGSQASEQFERWLKSDDDSQYIQGAAGVIALGPVAARWTPELIARLDSENFRVKMQSLFALEKVGPSAIVALDKLIEMLADPQSEQPMQFNVQVSICRTLKNLGPAANKATPALMHLAENGTYNSSRSMASLALGALGPVDGHDVVGLLLSKLSAYTLLEKERAIEGLGRMGPAAQAAVPALLDLMGDSTRAEDMKSRSAMPQAAAAYFLITDDWPTAEAVLQRTARSVSFEVPTIDAIALLGDRGDRAVPILVSKLDAEESATREAALWALSKLGRAAVPARERIGQLATSDSDAMIRQSAKMVLADLKRLEQEPTNGNGARSTPR